MMRRPSPSGLVPRRLVSAFAEVDVCELAGQPCTRPTDAQRSEST